MNTITSTSHQAGLESGALGTALLHARTVDLGASVQVASLAYDGMGQPVDSDDPDFEALTLIVVDVEVR